MTYVALCLVAVLVVREVLADRERRALLGRIDALLQRAAVERQVTTDREETARRARSEALMALVEHGARERTAILERQDIERQALLERIQRPERSLLHPVESFVLPEEEPDEIELVGTIAPPLDPERAEAHEAFVA